MLALGAVGPGGQQQSAHVRRPRAETMQALKPAEKNAGMLKTTAA
jgi:hypothetical protein